MAVALSAENWQASYSLDADPAVLVRPSQRPDRIETVAVNVLHVDGRLVTLAYQIHRTALGSAFELLHGPIEMDDPSGRVPHAFDVILGLA